MRYCPKSVLGTGVLEGHRGIASDATWALWELIFFIVISLIGCICALRISDWHRPQAQHPSEMGTFSLAYVLTLHGFLLEVFSYHNVTQIFRISVECFISAK